MMRRFAVSLFVLVTLSVVALTSSAPASASLWTRQSTITGAHLAFFDPQTGWAFGFHAIWHTTDAGSTWTVQYFDPLLSITDGVFANATDGWAVGKDGAIVATTDGGASWLPQASGTTGDLQALTFADSSDGWAVGADYRILHTTDGGGHWQMQHEERGSYSLYAVAFYDALRGCAAGDWGTVFSTGDGGTTWTQTSSGLTRVYALAMTSPTHVLAVGMNGQMASSDDGGKTWSQRASGTGSDLTVITFLDSRVGWIAGGGMGLLYTTDGGEHWIPEPGAGAGGPHGIAAIDLNTVWAGGGDGIYRSTHGGTLGAPAWSEALPSQVPQRDGPAAGDIQMLDAMHGWAAGAGGTLLHTSDGVTWTALPAGSRGPIYDLDAIDDAHVWAVGTWGDIVATADGGTTWSQQGQTDWQMTGVKFADDLHGWAVGWYGLVLRTTNGGTTWVRQTSGTTKNLQSVTFSDRLHGWAVGKGGLIIRTANGGVTWTFQKSGTSVDLASVAFVDALHGWVVGAGGTILHTTDGGVTWKRQASGVLDDLSRLAFSDAVHCWALGGSGALVTSNGGITWSPRLWAGGGLLGIGPAGSSIVWAAGSNGSLLVSDDGALSPAPATAATGLAKSTTSGWHRTSSTIALAATPGTDASPVAGTYYTVVGGPALVYGGPFSVRGRGHHRVEYWSADAQERLEPVNIGYVNIDDRGAYCTALKSVTVRHDAKATLPFSIDDPDPSCGYADVTIRITRNGKLVKVLRKARVVTSTNRSISFIAALPVGTYKWTVSATDIVGNPPARTTSRGLLVK